MFQQTGSTEPPTTLTVIGITLPTLRADLHGLSSLLGAGSSTHQRILYGYGTGGARCLSPKTPLGWLPREWACSYGSREDTDMQCHALNRLLLIAFRAEISQRCPAPWKLARAFETVSLPKLINTLQLSKRQCKRPRKQGDALRSPTCQPATRAVVIRSVPTRGPCTTCRAGALTRSRPLFFVGPCNA